MSVLCNNILVNTFKQEFTFNDNIDNTQKSVILNEILGRGTYGEVYKGTLNNDIVAVKQIANINDNRNNLILITRGKIRDVHFLTS